MPSYKLSYFDARGRAELTRLLFAFADEDYEDARIPMQEWPKYKPSMPFLQVPTLEIDGKVYAQSVAINAYLAKEFGLYGKTNIEMLQTDQVIALLYDFTEKLVEAAYEESETSITVKPEVDNHFKEEEAPKFMGFLEKLLKENGTGFFVGDALTLADMAVFESIDNCKCIGFSWIDDDCPELQTLVKKVRNLEKIKAYLASRKPTDF